VRDAEEPLVVDGRITDPSPGLSFSSIGIFGKLDITATQPLYTFGKISNRQEAAAHGVKAKEHAITDRKRPDRPPGKTTVLRPGAGPWPDWTTPFSSNHSVRLIGHLLR